MQRYFGVLQDVSGNAIVTATLYVYLANTTTAATIYSDNGSTTKDNSFLTDATDGTYEFWAANGVYDLVFSKTGYTFTDADTADIQLFDPAEDVQTTSTGNVGTGEDTLLSYTMPANTLFLNDHVVRITAWGTTAANANNKTIKLIFGSTTIISSGALGINAQDWKIEAVVVRTGASTQGAIATYFNETPTMVGPNYTTPAETLSGTVVIKCTGEATTTDDILQKGFIIEILNASG